LLPFFNFYGRMHRRTMDWMIVPAVVRTSLLQEFQRHHPTSSTELVEWAYAQAERFYGEKRYESGESYLTHATRVAFEVAQLGQDAATIAAALLHELTPLEQEFLRQEAHPLGLERALDLANGLERMLGEPFRP